MNAEDWDNFPPALVPDGTIESHGIPEAPLYANSTPNARTSLIAYNDDEREKLSMSNQRLIEARNLIKPECSTYPEMISFVLEFVLGGTACCPRIADAIVDEFYSYFPAYDEYSRLKKTISTALHNHHQFRKLAPGRGQPKNKPLWTLDPSLTGSKSSDRGRLSRAQARSARGVRRQQGREPPNDELLKLSSHNSPAVTVGFSTLPPDKPGASRSLRVPSGLGTLVPTPTSTTFLTRPILDETSTGLHRNILPSAASTIVSQGVLELQPSPSWTTPISFRWDVTPQDLKSPSLSSLFSEASPTPQIYTLEDIGGEARTEFNEEAEAIPGFASRSNASFRRVQNETQAIPSSSALGLDIPLNDPFGSNGVELTSFGFDVSALDQQEFSAPNCRSRQGNPDPQPEVWLHDNDARLKLEASHHTSKPAALDGPQVLTFDEIMSIVFTEQAGDPCSTVEPESSSVASPAIAIQPILPENPQEGSVTEVDYTEFFKAWGLLI
ncbi:hypothetical protein FRB90_012783 [Tulasnella sp. 427]|nr:hypothetical protein FRB90_012783 [Tulasnella sp. 427]